MNHQWMREMFQDVFNKVAERSSKDEDFRVLCKSNIHAAIKEGHDVPESIKINVVDSTGYHISFVLPGWEQAAVFFADRESEGATGIEEMIHEAIRKVKEKAAKDEDFRELCRLSIHGAIKEITGDEIPLSMRIQVIDNEGYHMSITLPPLILSASNKR